MIRILIAIVAVIVGLVVGMAANMGFVIINLQMFPLPDGVTWTDEEEIKAWLATLPQTAFILVFVAHLKVLSDFAKNNFTPMETYAFCR